MNKRYLIFKRYFDFILAITGSFIFFPLFCVIAVVLFLRQGRPVFFLKESLGKDKKLFNAIKFRSCDVSTKKITRLGCLLRCTAMDELPQLINILKGDLSFVGPRNYMLEKYNSADPGFSQRLKVTPGLTGLAQIFTPKHADDKEVLKWDLEYINNISFFLDLKIIFISLWVSLSANWENEGVKLKV